MKFKTFAINLKSNEFRRDHILDQQDKSGLKIEIFEAITPKTMAGIPHRYSVKKARKFTGRPLHDTEQACALSHIVLWRQLLADKDADYYLILEDDAILAEGLGALIDAIDFTDIDFLKLSGKIKRKMKKVQDLGGDTAVYRYAFGPLDAAAYMVSKKGAEKLIDYCEEMFAPVDILMDRSFEHGVTVYGVMPYPVTAEFCFDEGSPMFTSIGHRDQKYADDITIGERLCQRYYRLLGSVKRKLAIRQLNNS